MKNFLLFLLALQFARASSVQSMRVSIMAYNLENLFDTQDDPKVQDETYLPLSMKKGEEHKQKCKAIRSMAKKHQWDCLFLDWNDSILDAKMKNLAEQIFKAPGGKGPDVLIVSEVENRQVIEAFNKKHLAKAGYAVTHMDSKDERGIDQAILSRLPLIKYEYHFIAIEKKRKKSKKIQSKDLRGIIHAHLDLGNSKVLHVLALHLPSQGASFREREVVLNQLNKIAITIPANDIVVAGGDFNITSKEWEKEKVYPSYFENIWRPAHMDGCKECQGTYYYPSKKEWSFFDMLLLRFDREKQARWSWDAKSVQAIKQGKTKYPSKFEPNSLRGASDHLPIYAELVIN